MELKLTETELVRKKISDEIDWLNTFIPNAPDGLRDDLQALYDSRKQAFESISIAVENIVISIPDEAQTMASRYVISGTATEDTVNNIEAVIS